MSVGIIIPAHNEEEVISKTLGAFEEELGSDYEFIVVNDYSTDATASIVKNLARVYPNLRLIDNDGEKGFASALQKGFSVSLSDFVVPVMADLCDEPKAIKKMQEIIREGFDVVVGSRYMEGANKIGGPLLQSLFSRFVGRSLKAMIGIPTSDVNNSFKCFRREILNNIRLKSSGFEVSMELALKAYFAGYKIAEIPTTWRGRYLGKSKFYLFKAAPHYIKWYLWAVFKKFRLFFSP